jgi:MinD-like ATPase involved in chromosome partitioning or flagellar assembly
MKVITFYSYKGGVGRSLAAANFSVYLAKLGLKTVLIDFDLEAPGIDAKFPLLNIPGEQQGILDYILNYQLKNEDPGDVQKLCLQVPISKEKLDIPLFLIPAGQYLTEYYFKQLNDLDWSLIFSKERNGVAFFQQFLARLKEEVEADFVIIDSRTGITEIAGLCTQQLADEVVILSSLSSESIKVTKHIKDLIHHSQITKALGKEIEVKVVVSRVPKPENLEIFKTKCCEQFKTDETNLFFLFSCSDLEREEFLAITESDKSEELVSNYVRLFYGLNLKLASDGIRAEIERISSSFLFSSSPDESERKMFELVALYPHPDVYRAAMHFFQHLRKWDEVKTFAWKLNSLMPEDDEVRSVIKNIYLSSPSFNKERLRDNEQKNAIQVIDSLWKQRKLIHKESVRYAEVLENAKQYSQSLKVAFSVYKDEEVDPSVQNRACAIAARSAVRAGKADIAEELIASLSPENFDSELGLLAVSLRENSGESEEAFELAKSILLRDYSPNLIRKAVSLAKQLERTEELVNLMRSSTTFQFYKRQPSFIREMKQLGLPELTYEDVEF